MADKDFSHLDETGGISMVNVGAKRSTQREAVAAASETRRSRDAER
jgi:molybdenum cofactor biosynthesis enzyme